MMNRVLFSLYVYFQWIKVLCYSVPVRLPGIYQEQAHRHKFKSIIQALTAAVISDAKGKPTSRLSWLMKYGFHYTAAWRNGYVQVFQQMSFSNWYFFRFIPASTDLPSAG
jgi:hypothetical protein